MVAFRKIGVLFSHNTRFEIFPFALLPTTLRKWELSFIQFDHDPLSLRSII